MEKMIFLVGFMGSGKSYWGSRLAQKIAYDFVDLDTLIEQKTGLSIPEIFALHGEDGFRLQEQDCLHSLAERLQPTVIATGGGAPCFFDNMDWMNQHGTTIWLDTPVETLVERLWPERHKRPLLAQIPESDFTSFISERLDLRRVWYQKAKICVTNGKELSTSLMTNL
jgi:shikimate kinase